MIEQILAFIEWFFSLDMDAVTLPWAEANKYTIAFLLGAPYLIYKWFHKNVDQIRSLKESRGEQAPGGDEQ